MISALALVLRSNGNGSLAPLHADGETAVQRQCQTGHIPGLSMWIDEFKAKSRKEHTNQSHGFNRSKLLTETGFFWRVLESGVSRQ